MARKKTNKKTKASETLSDRSEKLKNLQDNLNKKFGKGSLWIGDQGGDLNLESIPTGSMILDKHLGIGGLPKGRIIEIFGPESSGKTTMALSVIAEAQKKGGVVGFVDAEHALDSGYARKLGVSLDEMLISQPDCGEDALTVTQEMVESEALDVVVVDSVSALTPKAEIDGEMGDSHMGLQARLMSQALRKLTGNVNKTNTMVIFINQVRMKIGVMFGNPETTSGGQALKFYSSVRLDVRRSTKIKEGEEVIGHIMNVKTVKNKVGAPHKKAEVPLIYGKGIDRAAEVYALAKQNEALTINGAHHYLGEEKLASSKGEMLTKMQEDPELLARIENLLKEENKENDTTEAA